VEGERKHFGTLLLGYYEDEKLRYAGKVGTGFSDEDLKDIGDKLENLNWDVSPYDDSVGDSDVHWVKPELVCEVKFTEWTDEGKLRHPAFLGLRRDKDPEKVVKETPRERS
jgi:ATP-dependent DNA ligase